MHEKILILGKKLGLFVLRVTHIESSHSLRQTDASGWVGLALWCLTTYPHVPNGQYQDRILTIFFTLGFKF